MSEADIIDMIRATGAERRRDNAKVHVAQGMNGKPREDRKCY